MGTNMEEWSEVTVYSLCIFITLLITVRNVRLSRGTQVDSLQLAAGIFLLAQFGACILDCIFYTTYNLCLPAKLARFTTFVIFQVLCNSVLITRITILVHRKHQWRIRSLLGFLFATSLLLCAIATFIGYQKATEDSDNKDDIDKCSMAPDDIILNASKLIKALMYLGLLACFRVPFNRIIRQIRSSDNISVDKLQTVSNKVFLQISLPIVIYCICAIIGFALRSWDGYAWVSYTLQDLSIFVAMSFTYAMAERENSVGSSFHEHLPYNSPHQQPAAAAYPGSLVGGGGGGAHLFQQGAAMSPTQSFSSPPPSVINFIKKP